MNLSWIWCYCDNNSGIAEALSRQQSDLGFIELSAACRLSAARLEQGINTSSTNQSVSRSSEYNLFLDSARCYSQLPDNITTTSCYEAAINSTHDETLAWLTIIEAGDVSLRNNDNAGAITFFTKALKLASDDKRKNVAGNKTIFDSRVMVVLNVIKDQFR